MKSSMNNLRITEMYKFAVFTILFFWGSIFFYPITTEVNQDVMFYLSSVASSLCISLLLTEICVPDHMDKKKIRNYLWYPMLSLSLPFISSFVLVRMGYSFSWFVNFVFANALLWITLGTNLKLCITFLIGIIGGAVFGLALNLNTPMLDEALFADFAMYSFIFLLVRTALLIRDRVYIKGPIEASE